MTFEKYSVRARLYFGFALILAILAAVTLYGVTQVHSIDNALRANNDRHVAVQRHAINFRGSAHDRSIAIRDVVLAASPADRRKEVETIDRLAKFYADSAGPLETMIGAPDAGPELPRLYAGIKEIENRTVATTRRIVALVDEGNAQGAQDLLWREAKPQYEQWLAAINKLIDFEESLIRANNALALERTGRFVTVMMAALAVALLIGGALAWSIARSILRQLGAEPAQLGAAARAVADGDLGPVPGAASAPSGSVLASLGSMQQSLARIVGMVRSASDSIGSASEQIAHGNNDLSQRTESQASNLQETSASMQQLSRIVDSNAATATQANQMAGTASAAAERGGEVVGQVVATMEDIAASSRKISDIIGVIDGIAFQTNILALNAAVEAARAGEQGRGFADVASEVRSLAQRSADAAREIKTLISASVDKVENGSRLVGDAGRTMDDIVGQVRNVTELIGQISGATSEQTHGIAEVGRAIHQLDDSTQQNAALVEQSAAASENLRMQAHQLAETVKVFKLDGSTHG